jgi:hypothetical protein
MDLPETRCSEMGQPAVDDAGFVYLAVKESDVSDRPSSLIAHLVTLNGPVQAVVWNIQSADWTFDPSTAAAFLYDFDFFEKRFKVDRARAEQIARDNLQTELPSEGDLRAICTAGLAAWMEKEDLSAEFEDVDDAWDVDKDA